MAKQIEGNARNQIMALQAACQQAEAQMRAYLQGYQDALGLEGDWILDLPTWTLKQIESEVTP